MKQPKNSVLTGVKALYLHGLISFNPNKYDFVFPSGASINYYKEKYTNVVPRTMIKEYHHLFTEIVGDYLLYTKERLLVEIDTFEIDHILKKEAIKNLYRLCDYQKFLKVYETLKKKNRFTPSEASLRYKEVKKVDFLGFSADRENLEIYIREYILNRFYDNNLEYIAKGGSVVESYGMFKRGTFDSDAYLPITRHQNIIKLLEERKDGIYFKCSDFNNKDFKSIEKYKRSRIVVKPKSWIVKLSIALKDISLIIDADYSLSEEEIIKIKDEYKIKERNLWKTNRKYVPLTRSMLLAEKILSSLDSQNKDIWRAKDLMDIHVLLKGEYKIRDVKKWLTFKIKHQNKISNHKFILENYKDFLNKLIKSKEEKIKILNETLSTYNVKDFDWDKCINFISEVIK